MSFTIRRVREEKKPSSLRRYAWLALPLIRVAAQYYRHFRRVKDDQAATTQHRRYLKRTVIVLLSTLLVLLLLVGTLKAMGQLKSISLGMMSMAGAELPTDEHGFTNILLLGEGDNDHAGQDLTDTLMIANIDPTKTKSVVLLSIPRDTYVLSTEKMGKDRINSLYRNYKISLIRSGKTEAEASMESLRQLTREVSTLLGLTLHGTVKVNFSGFEQVIDTIGGIDVNVPEDLVDTQYPGPNYSYETFRINKGPQHLDGATALKYARSRHSTSDFSRSARQQQIIAAAAKKVKEAGLIRNTSKLTELLSILSKNVESTLSTRELLGLANIGKSIDVRNIVSMQLNDQNGLYEGLIETGGFLYAPPREEFDGAAVLLPVSVPEFPITWKQVQKFTHLLVTERAAFLTPSTITVLNAGAKEGLARKLGGELYRYGFHVISTRNYDPKGSPTFETSFIAVNPALASDTTETEEALKRAKIAETLLSSILRLPSDAAPDAAPFSEDAPDIVIVLGKDYRYTPLQDVIE